MIKFAVVFLVSFVAGFGLVLALVLLSGHLIYKPQAKIAHYPAEDVLYLEELVYLHEPEAFSQEERTELLALLSHASSKWLLKKPKNAPIPFLSEKLESPVYAVKAVVPFNHTHFLFDSDGNLVGAHLPEAEAGRVRAIICAAGTRLRENPEVIPTR